MSQNALPQFRKRKWTPPQQVQTLPAAPESREQIFIDVGIAAIIASVPIAAFWLTLVI